MSNLDKLIKALRSGEYERGTFLLRQGNRYNVSGVACNVFRKETGLGVWDFDDPDEPIDYSFNLHGVDYTEYMPDEVASYFGFDRNDPIIHRTYSGAMSLADAEDLYGWEWEIIIHCLQEMYGIK